MEVTDKQMCWILRDACEELGSQRTFAEKYGYTPQFISMVISGDKRMPEKIGKILGYKKVKGWVKK